MEFYCTDKKQTSVSASNAKLLIQFPG